MLTIGSRGSQLALWQARWIQARLAEAWACECRIEIINTTGDKITDVALSQVGTKGLFTKEIEEALLSGNDRSRGAQLEGHAHRSAGRIHSGRHSGARRSARRAGRRAAGRAGHGRSRRHQFACGGRRSFERCGRISQIEDIRGNVDTRLRKLDEGQYDAIVLAAAGLRRLGWENRITEVLDPEIMCPAVGQGALAVETRDDGGAAQRSPSGWIIAKLESR